MPVRMFGIGNPVAHKRRIGFGPRRGDVLAVDVITPLQQPVDLVETATTGVHPDDRSFAFILIECECPFGVFHQGAEGFSQLQIAGVEAVNDDLFVLRRKDPAHLTAPSNANFALIAFGGVLAFLPAGHSCQVDVEQEHQCPEVMPEGKALLLKDEIERLHHLGDIGRGAGIPVSPGRPIDRRTPGGRKRVAELDPGAGGC